MFKKLDLLFMTFSSLTAIKRSEIAPLSSPWIDRAGIDAVLPCLKFAYHDALRVLAPLPATASLLTPLKKKDPSAIFVSFLSAAASSSRVS